MTSGGRVNSKFSEQKFSAPGREVLLSTFAAAKAAALRWEDSTRKSSAPGANHGAVPTETVLPYRVAPGKLAVDRKDPSADNGILLYSAVCTYLGSVLHDWHAETKEFMCRCHDALFNPVSAGESIAVATLRTSPILPINSVDGKLVDAGNFIGCVGAKRD